MDCSQFRDAYSDFADGLLDEIQEIAAHRHMSECPLCRRFHETLLWGVAELRRQPRVLPSDDFQEKLQRRIRAEASGFAPLARSWPGAAAMLMSLTLVAAAAFGWEVARGLPAQREILAASQPPVPIVRAVRAVRRAAARPVVQDAAISFDSLDLSGLTAAGEFAAVWSGQ